MTDDTKKPARRARAMSEAMLDEAIEESFPASDPLPTNPSFIGGPERSPPAREAPKPRPKTARRG